MIDKRKAVFIEYCVNCNNHAWCTKHDEGKYHHFFVLIKEEIEREYSNLTVYGNTNPRTGKPMIPTLGAFEITFKDRSVFSKLKTTLWPAVDIILKRMKNVMEGRDFSDLGAADNAAPSTRQQRNSKNQAALRNIISRSKMSHNQSFMSPDQEQKSILREAHRQEHSMMELIDESREEYLPKINGSAKKRDYTPTKLEGNGSRYMERSYVKLAYLDAERKIVNVVKDPNVLQKKFPRDSGNLNDHLVPSYPYYSHPKYGTATYLDQSIGSIKDNHTDNGSASKKESMASLHRGISNRQDYQPSEPSRLKEYRHGSGSVPASRRIYKDYRQDGQSEHEHEVNDTSILTDKTKRTEESDQLSAIRKREDQARRQHELKENYQLLSDQKQKESDLEGSKTAHATPYMVNQSTDTGQDEIAKEKVSPAKGIIELYKMDYPEQKLSEIQIAKNRTTRKKITITSDEDGDCRVNVYSTNPDILAPESREIMISKGEVFKIGLKFEYVEGKRGQDCCLFVFKNDQPWQKIIIKAYYS